MIRSLWGRRIPKWIGLPAFVLLQACSSTYQVDVVFLTTLDDSTCNGIFRPPSPLVGDTLKACAVYVEHFPALWSALAGGNTELLYTSEERPEAFRWATSDSTVVSVNARGVLHARRAGVAVISAETRGTRSDEDTVKVRARD